MADDLDDDDEYPEEGVRDNDPKFWVDSRHSDDWHDNSNCPVLATIPAEFRRTPQFGWGTKCQACVALDR
jgi:hypothetical protein